MFDQPPETNKKFSCQACAKLFQYPKRLLMHLEKKPECCQHYNDNDIMMPVASSKKSSKPAADVKDDKDVKPPEDDPSLHVEGRSKPMMNDATKSKGPTPEFKIFVIDKIQAMLKTMNDDQEVFKAVAKDMRISAKIAEKWWTMREKIIYLHQLQQKASSMSLEKQSFTNGGNILQTTQTSQKTNNVQQDSSNIQENINVPQVSSIKQEHIKDEQENVPNIEAKVNSPVKPLEIYGSAKKLGVCKQCPGCLAEDCGQCRQCLDKPKFGGPGRQKQKCVEKV